MLTQSEKYVISTPEVTNMMAKAMDELQATDFVREKRNDERWTWERIAEALTAKGYRSLRTGEPVTVSTVRNYYYYGPNPRKPTPQSKPKKGTTQAIQADSNAEAKLKLIGNILDTKADSDTLVKMLRSVLKDL